MKTEKTHTSSRQLMTFAATKICCSCCTRICSSSLWSRSRLTSAFYYNPVNSKVTSIRQQHIIECSSVIKKPSRECMYAVTWYQLGHSSSMPPKLISSPHGSRKKTFQERELVTQEFVLQIATVQVALNVGVRKPPFPALMLGTKFS